MNLPFCEFLQKVQKQFLQPTQKKKIKKKKMKGEKHCLCWEVPTSFNSKILCKLPTPNPSHNEVRLLWQYQNNFTK